MSEYAVVHGPRSGRRGAGAVGAEVSRRLRGAGHEVLELVAGDVDTARAAVRSAVEEGIRTLVAVGGDGMVRLAAGELVGSDTALGIVPAGTGNDVARALGIPLRPADALATLLAGSTSAVDVIRVESAQETHHVLGTIPCGVDARIARRAAGLPRWLGSASYATATLPEIARLRPMRYQLDLDGIESELAAHVVAVCNTSHYGGGMRIAPHADPADGLLDVVVIGPVRAATALGLLRGIFTGRHVDHPSVQVTRCRTVRVAGPDLVAFGDGDPVAPLPVRCAAVRHGIQVHTTPAGRPARETDGA